MFFSKRKVSFFSKKGVSPLIATVLLIAFTVALGAVVMNWGKGFVEKKAKDTGSIANLELSCTSDIELVVKQLGDSKRLCYDATGHNLTIMLENRGIKAIDGLKFTAIDQNDEIYDYDWNETLGAGQVKKIPSFSIGNDPDTTSLVQLEITPKLKVEGGDGTPKLCSKSVLREVSIPDCSSLS